MAFPTCSYTTGTEHRCPSLYGVAGPAEPGPRRHFSSSLSDERNPGEEMPPTRADIGQGSRIRAFAVGSDPFPPRPCS
jgi:hypothetical protein